MLLIEVIKNLLKLYRYQIIRYVITGVHIMEYISKVGRRGVSVPLKSGIQILYGVETTLWFTISMVMWSVCILARKNAFMTSAKSKHDVTVKL